jgi:hypothetical protein
MTQDAEAIGTLSKWMGFGYDDFSPLCFDFFLLFLLYAASPNDD